MTLVSYKREISNHKDCRPIGQIACSSGTATSETSKWNRRDRLKIFHLNVGKRKTIRHASIFVTKSVKKEKNSNRPCTERQSSENRKSRLWRIIASQLRLSKQCRLYNTDTWDRPRYLSGINHHWLNFFFSIYVIARITLTQGGRGNR